MSLNYAPETRRMIEDHSRQHLRMIESTVFQGEKTFDASAGLAAIVRITPQHGEGFTFFTSIEPISPEARATLNAMIEALNRRQNTSQFADRSDARRDVPRIAWRPGGVAGPSALTKARISVAVWSIKPLQAHAAAGSLYSHIEAWLADDSLQPTEAQTESDETQQVRNRSRDRVLETAGAERT